MAENGEKNGNVLRGWIPVIIFLAVQTAGAIWWAATTSSDVRAILRDGEKRDMRQQELDLKFQRLDKEFYGFRLTAGQKGDHRSSEIP